MVGQGMVEHHCATAWPRWMEPGTAGGAASDGPCSLCSGSTRLPIL